MAISPEIDRSGWQGCLRVSGGSFALASGVGESVG